MTRSTITIEKILLILLVPAIASATISGYFGGAGSPTEMYWNDLDLQVGAFLGSTGIDLVTIDLSPKDGRLYGIDNDGTLYGLNKQSGHATSIGDTGYANITSMAFTRSGDLYAYTDAPSQLVRIDTQTGEVQSTAPSDPLCQNVTAFAINDSWITSFGWGKDTAVVWDKDSEWLFTVNLGTGVVNPDGRVLGDFVAFDMGWDGRLYGMEMKDGTAHIDQIGTYYGQIQDYKGRVESSGGMFALVPEPTTILLLGVGGMAVIRRRRSV